MIIATSVFYFEMFREVRNLSTITQAGNIMTWINTWLKNFPQVFENHKETVKIIFSNTAMTSISLIII